ncbi:MAG: hypothetical protein WD874_01450 [Parcubacteria group bacterium]
MERKKIIWIILAAAILFAGIFLFAKKEGNFSFAGSKSEFISTEYKVALKYPSEWETISLEEKLRYEGENGFFEVTGAGGELTLTDIISSELDHVRMPYGSKPEVESIKIDGQTGVLLMPSKDADPLMKDQAVLILPYPGPVLVNGETYEYLVLWVDKDYIKEIAKTIEFLE